MDIRLFTMRLTQPSKDTLDIGENFYIFFFLLNKRCSLIIHGEVWKNSNIFCLILQLIHMACTLLIHEQISAAFSTIWFLYSVNHNAMQWVIFLVKPYNIIEPHNFPAGKLREFVVVLSQLEFMQPSRRKNQATYPEGMRFQKCVLWRLLEYQRHVQKLPPCFQIIIIVGVVVARLRGTRPACVIRSPWKNWLRSVLLSIHRYGSEHGWESWDAPIVGVSVSGGRAKRLQSWPQWWSQSQGQSP